MSKVFDPIRARSSVDALEMLCRQHPECAVNVTALREELEAADEQIEQLARALRAEVDPPTFMGEPVPHPANRAARIAMDPQVLRERRHTTQCKRYDNNCGAVHPNNCPDCPFRTAGVSVPDPHTF